MHIWEELIEEALSVTHDRTADKKSVLLYIRHCTNRQTWTWKQVKEATRILPPVSCNVAHSSEKLHPSRGLLQKLRLKFSGAHSTLQQKEVSDWTVLLWHWSLEALFYSFCLLMLNPHSFLWSQDHMREPGAGSRRDRSRDVQGRCLRNSGTIQKPN